MNNPHPTLILGAGGHGKVVLDILTAQAAALTSSPPPTPHPPLPPCHPLGFVDDNPALANSTVGGLPILGRLSDLPRLRAEGITHAIIAIGDNRARLRHRAVLESHGFVLAAAVHPAAFVSPRATLGVGVVVAPHATIITEARIADLAIVNTAAVVDHECDVGESAHIGPGALLAGRVRVGRAAFVGMGAKVIQCLTIGDHTTIGAGSVVTRDIPANVTAVGVPARVIKTHPPQA